MKYKDESFPIEKDDYFGKLDSKGKEEGAVEDEEEAKASK